MGDRVLKVIHTYELALIFLFPLVRLKQSKLIKYAHEFSTKVIEERRKTLEESALGISNNTSAALLNEDAEIGVKKRSALLDVLLQSTINGKALSNDDIREEVDTFMFEGHDTTTSAIGFALYLISRHPIVQEKLYEEIVYNLGKENETKSITLADLNKLKYMENVIKETLRLYPSVPTISRELENDLHYGTLKLLESLWVAYDILFSDHSVLGKGILPAGTEIIILLLNMMRDPKLFENPNDFIPERYEKNETISPFAYVPFSAGPRNCIGQKFAMLEIKMILVKTIRKYILLPLGEEVQPEASLILHSSNGFQLGLRLRDH